MSSNDVKFITLRNITAYNTNGSFIPEDRVLTVAQNGQGVWSNDLRLRTAYISSIQADIIGSDIILAPYMDASSIFTTTLDASSIMSHTLEVSSIYVDYITMNGVTYSSIGGTGPRGFHGPTGAQGDLGATGAQGDPGTAVNTGATGPQGLNGFFGGTGPTGETGPQGIDGTAANTGATGPQGTSFSFSGPTGAILYFDGNSVTGTTDFTYTPGGTGMYIMGNIIPGQNNTYDLGVTGAVWRSINMGPGTLNIAGPSGSNVIGTLGTDQNAIVYTQYGFATPFINIGPAINELDPGAIGGWVIGPTGTFGAPDYDLIVQQKLPGAALPAGLTGPIYSLLYGRTGWTGPQGAEGSQGSQGADGAQGSDGAQGTQGVQGSQGSQGAQGSQGVQGPTGVTGPIGITGAIGTGVTGYTGITGPTGIQGSQGAAGYYSIATTYPTATNLSGPNYIINLNDTTNNIFLINGANAPFSGNNTDITAIDNNFNGRSVTLIFYQNTGNHTLSFKNQDASAPAGQGFYLSNNSNVQVTAQGSITFVYSSFLGFWIQIANT